MSYSLWGWEESDMTECLKHTHTQGVGKIPWRRDRLPTPMFLGFHCDSAGKESACNAGDLGSIPGSGRCPGEGNTTHSSILAWRIPWTEKLGGL